MHRKKALLLKLRKRKYNFCARVFLLNFHRGAIESILHVNITNWHDSSQPRTGSLYSRWSKPLSDVSTEPKVTKRQHTPSHSLFTLLPPGNTYRYICCSTSRLQSSFFSYVVWLLNSSSTQMHGVQLAQSLTLSPIRLRSSEGNT